MSAKQWKWWMQYNTICRWLQNGREQFPKQWSVVYVNDIPDWAQAMIYAQGDCLVSLGEDSSHLIATC